MRPDINSPSPGEKTHSFILRQGGSELSYSLDGSPSPLNLWIPYERYLCQYFMKMARHCAPSRYAPRPVHKVYHIVFLLYTQPL